MAVFHQDRFDGSEEQDAFIHPTDRCFYCAEPLNGHSWIYWNGSDEKNQQIWLHPACAKRLADHLNKDFTKSLYANR